MFKTQVSMQDKILKMKDDLADHQGEALKHVGWLLYGARATGRTHLTCVVTIITAVENIGRPIRVYDHFSDEQYAIGFTFDVLLGLLDKYEISEYFEINKNSKTICYNPMKKITEKNPVYDSITGRSITRKHFPPLALEDQ